MSPRARHRPAERPRLHPGFDAARVRALLVSAGDGSLGERIERVSAHLLGQPYVVNPLGGGPDEREVLRASLHGFDCVTYVESVLAIARARSSSEFESTLRLLRYRAGRVAWCARNHYMTDWARENVGRGFVQDLTRGPETVGKQRRLSVVAGLPVKRTRFRCFPKRVLSRPAGRVATGDLILFASTRRDLDVFHVGLAVRRGEVVRLRHAAKSRGRVVEQPLRAFLAAQRMSGVILLRPVDVERGSRGAARR